MEKNILVTDSWSNNKVSFEDRSSRVKLNEILEVFSVHFQCNRNVMYVIISVSC